MTIVATSNTGNNSWEVTDCPYPNSAIPCCTAVWSETTQHWIGHFSFNFDKYLVMDNTDIYGMRNGQTFILNQGGTIGGADVFAWVLTAASPTQPSDKEFVRIRINSDNKPVLVEFYDSQDSYEADTPQCTLDPTVDPLQLKDYYGFEQYVPRRSDNRNRMQGRVMLYRISHNDSSTEFTLVDTEVQYKVLK
ncbi:MAG: hypothetical protein ACXABY_12560 [Candidatus Thorarchaeota archaeon]